MHDKVEVSGKKKSSANNQLINPNIKTIHVKALDGNRKY